jgi:hypothetical protein
MNLQTIKKHKLKLQNEIKAAIRKFQKATEGEDVEISKLEYVVEYHGGIDGIPVSKSENIICKLDFYI